MKSKIIFGKTDVAPRLPVIMTTVGYWEHQPETIRPAGFPDFQFHQIVKGQGKLVIRENEYIVGPGDVFFLFPDVPHRYAPISENWELAWVSFRGREASQLLTYAGVSGSGVSKLRMETLMDELTRMLSMDENQEMDSEIEYSKMVYALLLDLKRLLPAPKNIDYQMERIRPVLRHISQNLHREVPLAELAEIAAVSPQYLCRLFQKTMNIRPTVYINQERIDQSKKLMFSEGGKKLSEIAHLVGYENPSYFSAVFKRYTGMSPEEFKKLHGLN
ncbi:AraC family transcriptional regulator [Paenibacillus thermotolerans]|uniref:AraC family transcriptional regulator n=1 Tax=Paenibacillus thermotolerans TaxID=3027807 RepID=UPI002367F5ED|nr:MULTISPECIES: AraC family transcriptional regulator [unclassified Paenibacillus]